MKDKKDLEKLFNKEEGYYTGYDPSRDFICNVCGKVIYADCIDEAIRSEQKEVNGDILNFCTKCKKLPNRVELSKSFHNIF